MSQQDINRMFPDVTKKKEPVHYGPDTPEGSRRLNNAVGVAAFGMLMILVGMFLHAFIIWLKS